MPKIGEFCSSNIARFLLMILIALVLLALVFFFFFYASGRRSIEHTYGPNSDVIYPQAVLQYRPPPLLPLSS